MDNDTGVKPTFRCNVWHWDRGGGLRLPAGIEWGVEPSLFPHHLPKPQGLESRTRKRGDPSSSPHTDISPPETPTVKLLFLHSHVTYLQQQNWPSWHQATVKCEQHKYSSGSEQQWRSSSERSQRDAVISFSFSYFLNILAAVELSVSEHLLLLQLEMSSVQRSVKSKTRYCHEHSLSWTFTHQISGFVKLLFFCFSQGQRDKNGGF